MQRICLELTRVYMQSAKCAYSSIPIASDIQHSKILSFNQNSGSKIQDVSNNRFLSTNIAPAVEKEKKWISVQFVKADGSKIEAQGKSGDSLLDIINNNNLQIDGFGACEGTLSCSTCHVIFKEEDYKRLDYFPSDEEQDMLDLAYGLTDTCSSCYRLPDVQCITFAGCGFLGSYLLGAAACLENTTKLLEEAPMCGASAGALVAACLVCKIPTATLKQSFWSTAIEAQQNLLGAFSPAFSIVDNLRKGLSVLPSDAHHMANGRLHVSLTRAKDFKNVLISNWESREELIDCLLCSCFIPGFSGTKIPKFRKEKFIDGGFTDNLPVMDLPCLTISPFASHCDICPRDGVKNPFFFKQGNHYFACTPENLIRLSRSLFVPSLDVLEACYEDGFRQMDLYLMSKCKPYHVKMHYN